MGKILLFYLYTPLEHPKRIVKWQKKICQDLNLVGRILIGNEGINGTVSGTKENTDRYKEIMHAHPSFATIDFKESEGPEKAFPRLYITVRTEIVHLGLDPNKITPEQGGEHLTPQQVHELLQNKPSNLVVLDARNEVEWRIGKFTDAITPPINHFREFPAYIDTHAEQFKDKQVLMYCTGGIRCERASAYLKSKNIAEKVFQIKGGIHTYVEEFPNGFFRGKNYVFDSRIAVKITDDVLGSCSECNAPCDNYTNCLNALCNKHYISCDACLQKTERTCSPRCKELLDTKEAKPRPQRLSAQ